MVFPPAVILDYWFGAPGSATEIAARQGQLWFGKTPERDRDITDRFTATLDVACNGALDAWTASAQGRLALVIVLDQFPHHIHRDTAQAYAQDEKALALTLAALATGEDRQLAPIERVFLYLPLEHAESLSMQDLAVAQYAQLVSEASGPERALFENFLDYANRHREVILRFGRFPHRNVALSRNSSADESAFLEQPGSRF